MSETQNNPYAAPTATIVESTLAGDTVRKAERTTRLIAALTDGVLAAVAWVPLFVGVQLAARDNRTAGIVLVCIGLLALLALVVVQITMLVRYSQTLGKRWQGIRIVRTNGEHIGFGRIFGLRIIAPAVVGAIPFLGGVFSLANILWIFGNERRCLHDYFADTIVVNV